MNTEGLNLPNDVEQLKALVALRDATIAQRDAVISSQQEELQKQRKTLEGLQQQLARLLRRRYGPQQERIDPNQLLLFSAEELVELAKELEEGTQDSVASPDDSGSEQESSPPSRNKGHGRRPIPAHLPRETVVHELPESERPCPCCGRIRKEIGREKSEQLEFVPAQLKVIEHERVRYGCEICEEHIVIAPKPPQPIEKGLPGPGLLSFLTLSKYGDYLPLYRLEDILSRSGIHLTRSTLCGWVAAVSDLLKPLYRSMCERLRRSIVIHTDDTGIKMLAPDQCQNCKFWTYVGDSDNPFVVYEFSLTREGKEPSRFLQGFRGYLQADAFSGYDQVYSKGHVIEVACMAHCRRYWWEARETDSRRAHEAVAYITRLYAMETEFEKARLSGDALRDARQTHALPILESFKVWLKQEQGNVLPKSPIGQAFTYTLNQWEALCRYTEHGALQIDNNLAERMVKLPAIGRNNWLFVGSESGGERAAVLMSVIASAKHCQVEPWTWLNAVLKELPRRINSGADPPDLKDLLPDVWLRNHPEHRWTIDEIRKKERERSKQQKSGKRNDRR